MRGRNVFDVVATSYIRDDEHWGSDLDVLKDALNLRLRKTRRQIRYMDIGCGPGFHAVAIKRLYPEVFVFAFDDSERMFKEAFLQVEQMKQLGIPSFLVAWANILQLQAKKKKFDVITFLNNGLGNLQEKDARPDALRTQAIQKARSFLCRDGFIVVSVYNLKELKGVYGQKLRILSKSNLGRGELFIEYRPGNGEVVEYYSHWFTRKELVALLEQNGFKVELLEERMARLVVKARAV